MRISRLLYLGAGVCTAIGLWLRLMPLPSHPPLSNDARLPLQTTAVSGSRLASAPADGILRANVFSPQRTPAPRLASRGGASPTTRPGLGPALTLVGVTMGPRGAAVLIHADPKVRDAQLFSIGDSVSGGRLVAISESTATVLRSSGPLVLHLANTRKGKS